MYQLSLFDGTAEPLSVSNKKFVRKYPRFIKFCTTKQAAILLDISVSTLYRARQIGKSYEKNGWRVQFIPQNRWQLILKD